MNKQGRNESGKFAAKSNENRQVRSIRLTDATWDALGKIADERSITRADLVENWMDGEYFELIDRVKELELELQNLRNNSIQQSVNTPKSLGDIDNQPSITRKELDNELVNSTQLDLLTGSVVETIKPLNNTDLAKRLGIDPSNLSKYRKKGNDKLAVYTASKDPDGLEWRYFEVDKLYYHLDK